MSYEQLNFSTYCIGNLSRELGWSQAKTYNTLKQTGVLKDYVIACYDTAHTYSKPIIMDDIKSFLRNRNAL